MLEPISFTKVFFIDPQLNWGIFHAYSAPYNKTPSIGIEGVLFIVRFNLPISRFPLSTEADLHGFHPRAPQNADAVR